MPDPGTGRYPNVFRPLAIGPVTVRNRILVPAHTTDYGEDNLPSARHLAYHRERARGGAGLIIFEATRVHRTSLGRRQAVNGYEPAAIDAFAPIARAVQAEGAKLFAQIIHLGRHIDGNYARMPAWSASAVPWSATAPPPHPMTEAEIFEVVAAHGLVARNLMQAGLDGVEVTIGHGHLLQQFLSPASNFRTDRYGGSEANRMRFALETLHAVRAAVGDRIAVGIRISADEFLEGGLTLEDMRRITVAVCTSMRLDFVNVSHSAYHGSATISTQMADMAFPADSFHHLPRGIAAALRAAGQDIPVFAVCRFRRVAEAEAMLAAGDIAMVGMARAHIADAHLVRKAREGREDETRVCIGCNQGCAGFVAQLLPITCLVNPATGREEERPPDPAPAPVARRVLVVGGGPGGMEAAAIAARCGHSVTLWEAGPGLGGTLRLATVMPLRHDFSILLAAQEAALARAGVAVVLGRRATAADIVAFGADRVILATGAHAAAMALATGVALTMEQALADEAALGAHVAVQDNTGSWAIAGLVEYLAGTGRRVTVLAPSGVPFAQVNIYSGYAFRQRLKERRVRIMPLHTAVALAGTTLRLTELSTGDEVFLDGVDALIAPTHAIPDDGLAGELAALGGRVWSVGDCVAARSALEAVYEGHEAGRAPIPPARS